MRAIKLFEAIHQTGYNKEWVVQRVEKASTDEQPFFEITPDEFKENSILYHLYLISKPADGILFLFKHPKELNDASCDIELIDKNENTILYLSDSGVPIDIFEEIIKVCGEYSYLNWTKYESYVYINNRKYGPISDHIGTCKSLHIDNKGVFFVEPSSSSGYKVWDTIRNKEVYSDASDRLKPIMLNSTVIIPSVQSRGLEDIMFYNLNTGKSVLFSQKGFSKEIPDVMSCDTTDNVLVLHLDGSEELIVDENCDIVSK